MSSPEHLKTIGLKATLPRLRILELFEKSDVRHLAAEDVYKKLVEEGTDSGLATVYRVLTQFEQAGLLVRHHFESGKAVYELNRGSHHDHLVCVQCGHVEEFSDEDIVNLLYRAGTQCGIGEGRPDSSSSNGLGWGLFEIDTSKPISLHEIAPPKIEFVRSK
jgi:Fur family ferric uptake transcriptional regulator